VAHEQKSLGQARDQALQLLIALFALRLGSTCSGNLLRTMQVASKATQTTELLQRRRQQTCWQQGTALSVTFLTTKHKGQQRLDCKDWIATQVQLWWCNPTQATILDMLLLLVQVTKVQ
jgi:hypothetical protein